MSLESQSARNAQIALFCGSGLRGALELTPLLRALRQRSPDLRLLVALRADAAPVLDGTELVDRLISLPAAAWNGGLRPWLPTARTAARWIRRFLSERPTLCGIVWDRNPRLARAAGAWLYRAEVPRRFGFLRHPLGLFTDVVRQPSRAASVPGGRMRLLMNALGLRGFSCVPEMGLHREERRWAHHTLMGLGLRPGKPIVAVNPTASHRLKEWPALRYAELLDLLGDSAQRLVLGWGPRARHAERVADLCRRPTPFLCPLLNPRELAAVLSLCTVLVSGDADPLHLAAAVGTSVVALHGPTPPAAGSLAPLADAHLVLRHPVACSPCAFGERLPPCPHGHACLRGLETELVVRAVRRLLSRRAAARE